MKKLLLLILVCLIMPKISADDEFWLGGYVRSAITKQDLTDAYILLYDSEGNVKDSIRANRGIRWNVDRIDTTSYYGFNVPRVDSIYVFDVICEGFAPRTISYTLENIGKRESSREIPVIYLSRAVQLSEVTVNATKIKFYNKGDTLVYDASAFILPEGSMLDALISQLPGAELGTDGQIKVNGQVVETLLLDGKKFFDGDNNLMLENIAAYTVKNIQVYEGVSKENEAMGNIANKVLTMDVRLKKEYNIGWMVNAQGGYGTENRYMGRLFAAWFNPLWRVSLIGNLNNLNDNRQPGRNDTWTPEQMPSGRQRNSIFGVQYNYENNETKNSANGSFTYRHSDSDMLTRTDRTNFLSGGNTYEKSFSDSHNHSTSLSTNHWGTFYFGQYRVGGGLNGSYIESRNNASSLMGTFDENQDSISQATLDAIYSAGNQELLETVINRSKTQTDGWSKTYSFGGYPYVGYKLKNSTDNFLMRISANYTSTKNELWKDYEINYGPTTQGTEKLRQYFDNTPNHTLALGTSFVYYGRINNKIDLSIQYNYDFNETVKDSYMYALDRLADMGIFGTLPSGYLASFDPNNSYKSRLLTNTHGLNPSFTYYSTFNDKARLIIQLDPSIKLTHRHFNYWRNERDYRLSRTNFSVALQNWWSSRFSFAFRRRGEGQMAKYTNDIMYAFISRPELPDMFDMVDVINDSDPLNIYLGNPNLKQQIFHRHHFRWNWMPASYAVDNIVYFNYWYTLNALTRGYTYNSQTGVRHNKMYNVGGNRSFTFTNELKWQFGKSKQFTIDSYSEVDLTRYTDMIGVNVEEPVQTRVNNRRISQNFKFSWKVGNSNLGVRCDLANRYTTSDQEDFITLNATHLTSGVTAQINLPKGFSVNTDFMCYTRSGYGTEQLDTTDPVWNIRLAYTPPRNTKWVFMVDGYDMLHTLNNVSYTVNGAGRVVSYTNVLPRYFLFSVQYRLSLQPKKR
ncbi:MAG: TonB-dependent receptor [Paramuribaculum sp.]|nr:TonB-dependent receptor [Paramuribaculum sp.]